MNGLYILLLVGMACIFYFLYDQGYLYLNQKRALLYVGKRRGKEARFTSCSGKISRVVRVKETGKYTFIFDTELSEGTVELELLNGQKQIILHLDQNKESGSVTLEEKKKYVLVIHFAHASGSYQIDWKEEK